MLVVSLLTLVFLTPDFVNSAEKGVLFQLGTIYASSSLVQKHILEYRNDKRVKKIQVQLDSV